METRSALSKVDRFPVWITCQNFIANYSIRFNEQQTKCTKKKKWKRMERIFIRIHKWNNWSRNSTNETIIRLFSIAFETRCNENSFHLCFANFDRFIFSSFFFLRLEFHSQHFTSHSWTSTELENHWECHVRSKQRTKTYKTEIKENEKWKKKKKNFYEKMYCTAIKIYAINFKSS